MGQVLAMDGRAISRAAETVMRGGLVVYPTDTVYGLGCDPFNEEAVRRLFSAKGRGAKAVPVLCSSREKAADLVDLGPRGGRAGQALLARGPDHSRAAEDEGAGYAQPGAPSGRQGARPRALPRVSGLLRGVASGDERQRLGGAVGQERRGRAEATGWHGGPDSGRRAIARGRVDRSQRGRGDSHNLKNRSNRGRNELREGRT